MPAYPGTALGAVILMAVTLVGACVWVIRHLLTVTIPNKEATFLVALEVVQKEHKAATQTQAAEAKAALQMLLDHHERHCKIRQEAATKESGAMLAALQDQGEALEGNSKALAELTTKMTEQGSGMRELAQGVRELAAVRRQRRQPPSAPL